MKKIALAAAIVCALQLSGCATTKRSSIAFAKNSGGSLSVWNPDMSAAVAYADGKMCMQRALAVTTLDAQGSGKMSEAVLNLSKAAASSAARGGSGELASLNAAIKQTATVLTTTTEKTAFLDLGMFYLCQLSANGSITADQTTELLKALIVSSGSVESAQQAGSGTSGK